MPVSTNYIHRLQNENAEHAARAERVDDALRAFMAELDGPKFVGVDSDGGRKDWMATADIRGRLEALLATE